MFWTTFQIVTGIITPFFLVGFLIWLLNHLTILAKAKALALEAKLEDIKKQPPYDDVQISQPPNQKMYTIKLIKNGEVVFEESLVKEESKQ